MAIKTNLWQGDRVKLSEKYLLYRQGTNATLYKDRVGTVVNNTVDPNAEGILVRWDGNKNHNHNFLYQDDDLTLFEDETV